MTKRGSYSIHVGSAEHRVSVQLLGTTALHPGDDGLIRIHLPVALAIVRGDHYLLREDGRGEMIGGGQLLDVAPVLPASRARPSRQLDDLVAERGWIDVEDLLALTGERRPPTVGRWAVSPQALATAIASLRRTVDDAGPLGVDPHTLDERAHAVLPLIEDLETSDGRLVARSSADQDLTRHPYLGALRTAGFSPPAPDDVEPAQLRELARRRLIVRCDGVWFAADTITKAARLVADLLTDNSEGVSVSQVRTQMATSRKFAIRLLNHLDRAAATRRLGDKRVPGPRLAELCGGGGRESNPPSQDRYDHPL